MRRFLLAIIAACFCMVACEKGSPLSPGLFGKWEMRRQYGGFAGIDSVYKPGNGAVLQFSIDSTYKWLLKGKLTRQGAFHIKKKGYHLGEESYDEIIFDGNSSGEPIILNGTQLTIGTTVTDGIAVDYAKILN